MTARRGRRRKQMLGYLKETGVSWKLKAEAFYLLKDRYIITVIYEARLFVNISCVGPDLEDTLL